MKDPAFNFYSDNFLSGTMFFTDEQVGKYIRLLCAQHQTGHLEEKHMIFICKGHDDDIWKKFKQDEQGLYYNERLEIEILKRKNYSLSRSNNRIGKQKKGKKICSSYDEHMGIGNGIGNRNKEDISMLFENFRKKYPGTKRSYQTEFDNYRKKHKDWNGCLPLLEASIDKQITIRNEKIQQKQFVPPWKNLQTWINQRCWEEEFTITEIDTQKPIYERPKKQFPD